ncbi:hypothetical protein DPMN_165412 [Dreissena polymorpha]|uniref:Uncharacterized protein n=1 Tax=Dreissena polymorpha TaxID=45954 RepID=A0A9D4EWT4_DREPO|nr:hypothetical protein DPMN_165412 [Dreissena polymorpha]
MWPVSPEVGCLYACNAGPWVTCSGKLGENPVYGTGCSSISDTESVPEIPTKKTSSTAYRKYRLRRKTIPNVVAHLALRRPPDLPLSIAYED